MNELLIETKMNALIEMLADYCRKKKYKYSVVDTSDNSVTDFWINDIPYSIKWSEITNIYDVFKSIIETVDAGKTGRSIYISTTRGSGESLAEEMLSYCQRDVEITHELWSRVNPFINNTEIKDVIFNPPATIILWNDGTKTVVKAQDGEPYDPEKGFTMAVTKKHFGNEGNYYTEVKKWLNRYKKKLQKQRETEGILCKLTLPDLGPAIKNMDRLKEAFNVKNQKLDLCYKFDNNTKAILDEAGREQINKKLNDLDTITKAIDICHNGYSCDGCPYEGEELCLDHYFYSKTVDYLKEYKDLLKKEIGE